MFPLANDRRLAQQAEAWAEGLFAGQGVSIRAQAEIEAMRQTDWAVAYDLRLARALAAVAMRQNWNIHDLTFGQVHLFVLGARQLSAIHCAEACESWGERLAVAARSPLPPIPFRSWMVRLASAMPELSMEHRLHLIDAMQRLDASSLPVR